MRSVSRPTLSRLLKDASGFSQSALLYTQVDNSENYVYNLFTKLMQHLRTKESTELLCSLAIPPVKPTC